MNIPEQEMEGDLDTSLGFPFWRILNSEVLGTDATIPARHLYVLLQTQDFREEILRQLLTGLAGEYSEPELLFITVSNEAGILEAAINRHRSPILCYPNNFLPESGYLIALYCRNGIDESFYYTPSIETNKTCFVDLRQAS